MAYNLSPSNPYAQWLEETPEALYSAFTPSGSRSFLDYFRGRYGNVYQDYMGQLARTGLQGQAPTQSFADYLTGYPFLQEWMRMSPEMRGQQRTGRTIWNIGR